MKILQINSSIRSSDAHSSKMATAIAQHLLHSYPQAELLLRDLAANPPAMLDGDALLALSVPGTERTAAQHLRVAQDDALITEIQAADILILGVPMYNFGIPAQLKNWIDAICRARVTFQYTAHGVEGLLKHKKVFVALARGGIHKDTVMDSQVPYLTSILGFLGMTEVQYFYAEGLALGEASVSEAYQQVHAAIAGIKI